MRGAAFLLVLSALLSGCDKAVIITAPAMNSATKPIRYFSVHFQPRYESGFKAELDGQNITQAFKPAAVAGGDAIDDLLDPQGFTTVTAIPAPPPPPPLITGAGSPSEGTRGSPAQGPADHAPPPGSSTGDREAPKIPFSWHTLRVWGACRNDQLCESDQVSFLPIHLYVSAKPYGEPAAGNGVPFIVEVYPKSTVPIDVVATPTSNAIALNDAPPGQPAKFTIPAGHGYQLAVHGISGGSHYVIFLTAPGIQRGVTDGTVVR